MYRYDLHVHVHKYFQKGHFPAKYLSSHSIALHSTIFYRKSMNFGLPGNAIIKPPIQIQNFIDFLQKNGRMESN